MTIHLYDGMAVLRRRFDKDVMGRGPRNVFVEMLNFRPTDVAIWCFEGRQSLAARRAIYPPYKVRDSTMTDGLHALIELTRATLQFTKAIQVTVDRREADDVIAHLCREHGPTQRVVVHTVDRDLLALQTDNVRIEVDPLKNLEPRHIRLYKTFVGDQSDKIPGMKGFGIETFKACDPVRLDAAFQALMKGRAHPADFEQAGVKTGMALRICDAENVDLLTKFWTIIGFLPMPDNWAEGMIVGQPNFAAGDQLLREFMH